MRPTPLRATATWASLVVAALALAVAPAGAQATEADASVATLRQEAAAASQAYFDALGRAAELQVQIDALEAQLPTLTARRKALLSTAQDRAAVAYRRSGVQLGVLFDADGALDAARRTQWLDRLNARDHDSFRELGKLTDRIEAQRDELRTAQQSLAGELARLEAAGHEIDAKLQAAEDRQHALQVAAAQAAAAAPRRVAGSPAGSPAPGGPPPDYAPTPGEHPQHNQPFLVCTRARESGGNYGAYNPAGPYMGAYQFLQSTWNGTANRAGRPELIGVPPNTASQYDQDDMAWALFQRSGAGPWGGRCV